MKRRGRPPSEATEIAILERLEKEIAAEIARKQGHLEGVRMAIRILSAKAAGAQ